MKDLTRYTDFLLNETKDLLNIDSPTGYTEHAAAWVKKEFEALGFKAALTAKGGVLVSLGGEEKGTACCWKPTRTPWAAWWRRSRITGGCG